MSSELIKDNILFGLLFDEGCYQSTLEACALGPDLALFDNGDETEIGKKGVLLSGGQKAQVALACAVYARTQFVVLDDVFSDLVNSAAGWQVQLDKGQIKVQGTPQQLQESGALLQKLEWDAHNYAEQEAIDSSGAATNTKVEKEKKSTKKLVEDEARSIGSVTVEVYRTYLSAGSYWLFGLLVLFLALGQTVQLLQKFWIKYWGESYNDRVKFSAFSRNWLDFGFPPASHNVVPYLSVYLII
ncbi:unnamed protein product [Rhizoctonia solani]|uniref:ABC transporter domain-containing protein n=1 Tax=Rhizoctonia solani TaxID=456999 RepID=A0A8H3B0N8_9AGAM|nr:unnamed protein product [Rhizoctonia solani]